jgi:uncharacterized membrane protein YeaQ/YmgE (transglycosylase-associated protein family)
VIGTIIGAIVVGLIVGALARLVMPGKQNIGLVMTILLGAIGSFLGTWLTYQLGYSNSNGGFEIIPFLVGIIVAILLIAVYLGVTGKRGARGNTVRR